MIATFRWPEENRVAGWVDQDTDTRHQHHLPRSHCSSFHSPFLILSTVRFESF